jgi:hypothetical protein
MMKVIFKAMVSKPILLSGEFNKPVFGVIMPNFYVNQNQQANGDNEVHRSDDVGCQNPASSANRVDLGRHSDCHGAVKKSEDFRLQGKWVLLLL